MAGIITLPFSNIALQSTTAEVFNDAQNGQNTVYQLTAASAAAIRRISVAGVAYAFSGNIGIQFLLLTGAGGSEVTRTAQALVATAAGDVAKPFFCQVQINMAAGTRIAWKYTSAGTCSFSIQVTVEEA